MQHNNDKRLDIPSEANSEKHINFLEAEETTAEKNLSDKDRFGSTDEDRKRKDEWQQGLEKGRNENKSDE